MTHALRMIRVEQLPDRPPPSSGPGTLIVHATMHLDPDWDPEDAADTVRKTLRANPFDRATLAVERDDDGKPFLRIVYVISNPAILDVPVLCQSLGIPDGYFVVQSVEIA